MISMNSILLSFLCGAAFLGGATTVVVLISYIVMRKNTSSQERLYHYWEQGNENQREQIEVLERLVTVLTKK